MKIFFYSSGNPKLGSNRIYISNLSYWLSELGEDCLVSDDLDKSSQSDVCILNKFTKINDIKKIKKINPNCKIGLIHPSDLQIDFKKKIENVDFFITGSIEERDHYLFYKKNIFRFPQIERISQKLYHHDNDKKYFKIGYHGNLEHLKEMDNSVKKALEKISKIYKIKLIVVYDISLGKWKKGRPNIEIEETNWTFENMLDKMSSVDIGIVPCTNNFFLDKHYNLSNFLIKLIKKFYGRANDYNLQFKATSNSGRAFVFHQLGIPVIADFWPSNFEILDNNQNGYIAHSEKAWFYSIEKLINSPELRNSISKNAQKSFNAKYDPLEWASSFLIFLKKIL